MLKIPEKTLAYRNNNPGNLRFAGQRGAVQGEGGFARFETPEAGWNAMVAQVDLDSRRGHTVNSFINKYAPPVENDTNHYLDFVTKEAGIDRNAKLADIDRVRLAKAMAKLESGTTFQEMQDMSDTVTTEETPPENPPEPPPEEPSIEEEVGVQPKPALTMDNLEQLLAEGIISDDEANDFMTREELKGNLLDMSPDGIEDAYNRGLVTDEQVDVWADYQEHPVWFYVKDIAKAPIKGVEKMVESAANAVNEILMLDGILGRAEIPDVIGDTNTLAGTMVETVSQAAIPYAVAGKALTALGTVKNIMSGARMTQLAQTSPKLAALAESLIHGTMAGAAGDYVAFDPFEGRGVDVLEELGVLPEFLDFMTTDDNDPAPIGRLKNVLEGAIAGPAFEVIFAGVKGLKAAMVRKHMGSVEKIAEEVVAHADPRLKAAYDEIGERQAKEAKQLHQELLGKNADGLRLLRDELKVKENLTTAEQARLDFYEQKLAELDPNAKIDEGSGKGQDEIVDSGASQSADIPEGNQTVKQEGPQTPDILKKQKDKNLTAVKILQKQTDGTEPKFSDKLTEDIESFIDGNNKGAADLMRHIYEEAAHQIDDVRKIGTTHKMTEAKSSKILNDTMKEAAKVHGRTEKDMFNAMRGMVGKVFTDMQDMTAKVRAMNRFFVNYATSVDRLIDGCRSFEDKLKALEHIKFMEEMEAMVYGVRSEAGRLLNSYNMKWQKGRFDFQKLPKEAIEDIRKSSEKKIDDALKHYRQAKKTGQKLYRARNLGRNKFLGGLLEYVQLNLLYNPMTQVRNILSQTGTFAWKSFHRTIAVGWEAYIKGDRKALRELTAWAEGTKSGLSEAFRLVRREDKKVMSLAEHIEKNPDVGTFWKAIWTGDSITDPLKKLEGEGSESYFSKMLQKAPGSVQTIGKLLRWPFHGLTGFDEAFKCVGYHAELHSNLLREGWARGLDGADLDLWMHGALKEPPVAVHFEALRSAREMTFQDPLDKFSGGIEKALNSGNFGLATRIIAAPFYKITVNMMKYAGRNSVFAPLSRQWRKEWLTGGVRRYEAVSKMLTGTAIMVAAERLYSAGIITGRCPEPLRELWNAEGRQEYSIKIGNKYYSYKWMEPFATVVGLAADMHMAVDYLNLYKQDQIDGQELFYAMLASFTSPVTSKTWMTSIEELLGLLAGHSNMNPEKFGLRQMEKFVPGSTGLDQAQRSFNGDPNIRELRNIQDLFWKKVNTANMSVRQHDIYGTDLIKEPNALGLFKTRTETTDPVIQEMVRIKCNVQRPADYFTINGATVKLTDKQYIEYNRVIASLPMKELLNKIITDPQYLDIKDPDTRSKILKRQISIVRDAAKRIMIGKDKTIEADIIQQLHEKRDSIIGLYADEDPTGKLYKYRHLMK